MWFHNFSLPRYEHVVYVLDGLLYTLAHWPRHLLTPHHPDQSEPLTTPQEEPPYTASEDKSRGGSTPKKQRLESDHPSSDGRFFKRTESVLVSREEVSSTQLSNDRFFGVNGGANLALENPELVGPPNQWGKQVESFSRPLNEEYPLASRPHLLKPFARKEVLFGSAQEGGGAYAQVGGLSAGEGGAGGQRRGGRKGRKRKHSSANDRNK